MFFVIDMSTILNKMKSKKKLVIALGFIVAGCVVVSLIINPVQLVPTSRTIEVGQTERDQMYTYMRSGGETVIPDYGFYDANALSIGITVGGYKKDVSIFNDQLEALGYDFELKSGSLMIVRYARYNAPFFNDDGVAYGIGVYGYSYIDAYYWVHPSEPGFVYWTASHYTNLDAMSFVVNTIDLVIPSS